MQQHPVTFLLVCLAGSAAAAAPVDYVREVKPVLAQLSYRFQGRDFRLADVHGELVTKLLA